ncbi:HAMP domain-containing sensor histidine kinase [Leifsonia sp. YIM 134122]|uniref:histidine kinase n=1 Tax=Leifsonia stereocauli TaxID=3134136 RepID=A0ABU9W6V5_9MICO
MSEQRVAGVTAFTKDRTPTDAAAEVTGPRAPMTLVRRLLITVIAVLAVVSTVIGLVSVLVLQASLMDRVDTQLASATKRGYVAVGIPQNPNGGRPSFRLPDAVDILGVPSQAEGTIAVVAQDGAVQSAGLLDTNGDITRITVEQGDALAAVPADRQPHTVTLSEPLGQYRAVAVEDRNGGKVVIGLPLAGVNATVIQLTITIAIVALLGILIVALLGARIVRIALRPLTRVTQTAQRVAQLPLDRGEVALAERVPDADADERTEVGQVGAALNTMLDHVGAALEARQESEQKVRRFVADASHELRTPLASIRGYSELTRRSGQEVPPDTAHALSRIESESVRMTGLVEDLLLLARLDEGRELAHDPVDLTSIMIDAIGDAHVSGPDHDWEVDLPEEPVVVDGDAPRLHQVVVNLLANARVHTPGGTSVVARLTDAGDSVSITVQDDGPGIDPAISGTLFERFTRGDVSRTRATGSTGLGLAIVQAVVEAHGGTVSVASEPGDTTFTVILPRDRPLIE